MQSWAYSFKEDRSNYPLFGKLYGALKSSDNEFPPEEECDIIKILTENPVSTPRFTPPLNQETGPFEKLEKDLKELSGHLDLIEELYLGDYEENKQMILEEIDFLEQCRPRMEELILAASFGTTD